MIVLPRLSWAVTVTLTAVPAVAVDGALTTNREPGAEMPTGVTAMPLEIPVAALTTVSDTVTVRIPVVFRVTAKVRVPLVSVVLAGRVAAPSLEAKCTVPA